ncbi:bacteriophage abortive infection AbiH family protein [Vibrio owensii]|uniref:bacteriophage abortive infection AbiH family protein n=1 Tax=Vibrio owensii TaxID=696485 RepID=UPI00406930BC
MKLYVIGNGFDIHHGLNTRYSTFGLFLKNRYSEIYDLLLEHYGFVDLDPDDEETLWDPLWSEFEKNLSLLDTQTVMEAHEDSLAVPSSDEFRDRDWGAFQIDMEMILEQLTVGLYKAFKEFILAVEFPPFDINKEVNLDRDAKYLTFNYTDTLANYYAIPECNVLFIHEKAEENDVELVLGHGVDPANFEDKPERPPEGLTDEELEDWRQYMADQYDYSYELGKETINRYFTNTFKGTDVIIERNEQFFSSLEDIDEVIIIGHSLAEVDLPYFKHIAKSVKPNTRWIATYYSDKEKSSHFNTLTDMGVKNISVVKIEDL